MKRTLSIKQAFASVVVALSATHGIVSPAFAQRLCDRVEETYQAICPAPGPACDLLESLYFETRMAEPDGSINITVDQMHRNGDIPQSSSTWQVRPSSLVPGGKFATFLNNGSGAPYYISQPGVANIENDVLLFPGTYKVTYSIRRGGQLNTGSYPHCSNPTECNDFYAEVRAVTSGDQPSLILGNGGLLPMTPLKAFAGDWSAQMSGPPDPVNFFQRTAIEYPSHVFQPFRILVRRAGIYRLVTHGRSLATDFGGIRIVPDSMPYEQLPTAPGTPFCSELP